MRTSVPPAVAVPAETADTGFTTPQNFPRGSSSRLTKEELDPAVRDAATGDPAAVAKLIAMITPVAVRYCRARLGGRDLSYLSADDVAQEVCLAVLHALPNYQDRGGSFLYLVHAIASNKVADAYRLVSRDRSDPVAELPERPLADNEPEKHVLDGDLGARLSKLIATLPPLQQEILTLRLVVGLSAGETAEALGISPGNVRVTQHRALTKLRAMVTREGDLVG
ncbi:RNA polymerase sigma factor ShbA [Amycolatopsis sp. K13G38]|uniref:RNA polymerase sigma factor ShbA n=1 Tax=Amycolatopsis acididurans TaxID=2724524 RepID=A0ABX1J6V2_9PSEU|nr:RNA polymerase sigma factor ShbA [Amycolatopsis acididurans]NKQ54125.1 RNA polymerase sigma factor ShbA [Amycolatopsis acididurans]